MKIKPQAARSSLADMCECSYDGSRPPVLPHKVEPDESGTLCAHYACPCGRRWPTWWDAEAAGWPDITASEEAS